ncbi:MAG: site-specific DNA-methyltransferase [Planctomycetota bacterium]
MPRWLKQVEDVVAGKRRFALVPADCLDAGRAMPELAFDSCIIDPPYGMRYQGKNNMRDPIANDESPFIWWLHDAYRSLKDDAALACFCNWKNQEAFKFAIEIARFNVRNHAVWDRMNGGMGHTGMTLAPRHDVIWYATKGRFRFPNGRPDSVFPVPNVPTRKREHSTQKPDELMRRLVKALTPKGGIVYDPTMGSGSTGVAAIAEGCRFIGVELDPLNFDTAKRRITLANREYERRPKACLARRTHATLARVAA